MSKRTADISILATTEIGRTDRSHACVRRSRHQAFGKSGERDLGPVSHKVHGSYGEYNPAMVRKLMQLCVVTCVFTVFANAQQRGGGNAPAPAPPPQPGTNRPTVTPQPAPTPAPNQNIVITGRLIGDPGFDFPMVEVRFEYDGGQPIGFAYARSSG